MLSRAGVGRGTLAASTTTEAVDGRISAPNANRIRLKRQQRAGAADDLVFVFVAGARAGHEDLPIAIAAHAHGVAPSVPEIEVADDADALRIRRPHHESHALDAVQHQGMGAELVVEAQVIAFAEEIQVEIGQNRREAVGVFQLDLVVAEAGTQPVVLGIVERAGE